MTPLLLIDCASSCNRASSIGPRGWNSFGARRSMSGSCVDDERGSSGTSGISALRPLPRAGRFSMSLHLRLGRDAGAFEDFAGKRDVRGGTARFHVVEKD